MSVRRKLYASLDCKHKSIFFLVLLCITSTIIEERICRMFNEIILATSHIVYMCLMIKDLDLYSKNRRIDFFINMIGNCIENRAPYLLEDAALGLEYVVISGIMWFSRNILPYSILSTFTVFSNLTCPPHRRFFSEG